MSIQVIFPGTDSLLFSFFEGILRGLELTTTSAWAPDVRLQHVEATSMPSSAGGLVEGPNEIK